MHVFYVVVCVFVSTELNMEEKVKVVLIFSTCGRGVLSFLVRLKSEG